MPREGDRTIAGVVVGLVLRVLGERFGGGRLESGGLLDLRKHVPTLGVLHVELERFPDPRSRLVEPCLASRRIARRGRLQQQRVGKHAKQAIVLREVEAAVPGLLEVGRGKATQIRHRRVEFAPLAIDERREPRDRPGQRRRIHRRRASERCRGVVEPAVAQRRPGDADGTLRAAERLDHRERLFGLEKRALDAARSPCRKSPMP